MGSYAGGGNRSTGRSFSDDMDENAVEAGEAGCGWRADTRRWGDLGVGRGRIGRVDKEEREEGTANDSQDRWAADVVDVLCTGVGGLAGAVGRADAGGERRWTLALVAVVEVGGMASRRTDSVVLLLCRVDMALATVGDKAVLLAISSVVSVVDLDGTA